MFIESMFIGWMYYSLYKTKQKVRMGGLDLDRFKNENGFEQIAKDLGIKYPDKEGID